MSQFIGFATIPGHRSEMQSARPDAPVRPADAPGSVFGHCIAVAARALAGLMSRVAQRIEPLRRSDYDVAA